MVQFLAIFRTSKYPPVTFFLTASRANSYYTSIKSGPTKLKLVFMDQVSSESQYSIATSAEVAAGTTLPIDTPWYTTFKFDTPVSIGPGTTWQLLDGDDNIYSAVWLHLSDTDSTGLPGTAETHNCQYSSKRNAWYSVMFGGVDGGTTPSPSPPLSPSPSPSPSASPSPSPTPTPSTVLIQAENYDTAKSTNAVNQGSTAMSTATNAEFYYDFNLSATDNYIIKMRMRLRENIVSVAVEGNEKFRGEIPQHDQLMDGTYTQGNWDTWELGLENLQAGKHTLKIKVVSYRHGGQEFDWFEISPIVQMQKILTVHYHEQETGLSCFAASAHNFIYTYANKNISETDFCKATFGPSIGGLYYKIGLVDLLGNWNTYKSGIENQSGKSLVSDNDITWDEVTRAIDGGYPIIASFEMEAFKPGKSGKHVVLIVGYGRENKWAWQKIYLINPSKGSGNPYSTTPQFNNTSHILYMDEVESYLYKALRVK